MVGCMYSPAMVSLMLLLMEEKDLSLGLSLYASTFTYGHESNLHAAAGRISNRIPGSRMEYVHYVQNILHQEPRELIGPEINEITEVLSIRLDRNNVVDRFGAVMDIIWAPIHVVCRNSQVDEFWYLRGNLLSSGWQNIRDEYFRHVALCEHVRE